jgi:hypothetical protein
VLVFLLGAAFQALVVINAITAVLYLPSDAVVVLTGILGALIGAAIYLGVGLLALRFIFRQADEGHPGVGWGIAAGCLVPILVFGLCTAAALPGLLLYQL